MSDIPQGDELLKAFPEWTETEEELWLDRFQAFSDLLIGARLDPEAPERKRGLGQQERYDIFRADLMMAGELADAAVEEMQTRFSIQDQQKARQRRRAKQAYQTRRAERLGNRK